MGITIQILSFLGTRGLGFIVTDPRGQCWGARKARGGCFSPSQQSPHPSLHTSGRMHLGRLASQGAEVNFPTPPPHPPTPYTKASQDSSHGGPGLVGLLPY